MMTTVCCLIYYVCAAIETIPAMVRIWARKSSTDYSLASQWISITGTIAWTVYVYTSKQAAIVYLGTVFDCLMAVLYTFLVIRYHNGSN